MRLPKTFKALIQAAMRRKVFSTVFDAITALQAYINTANAALTGLGTASAADHGEGVGEVPSLDSTGRLNIDLIPPSSTALEYFRKYILTSKLMSAINGDGITSIIDTWADRYEDLSNINATESYGYVHDEDTDSFVVESGESLADLIETTSEWNGQNASWTWNGDGTLYATIRSGDSRRNIRRNAAITGDFTIRWRHGDDTNISGAVMIYSTYNDGGWNDSTYDADTYGAGGMLATWSCQLSYDNTLTPRSTHVSGSAIAHVPGTDVWEMTRVDDTVTLSKNGVVEHTFADTYSGEVRVALLSHGYNRSFEIDLLVETAAQAEVDITGETASAVGDDATNVAANVLDGDTSTYWRNTFTGDGSSDWVQVDLSSAIIPTAISLWTAADAAERPTAWDILGWDGAKWIHLAAVAQASPGSETEYSASIAAKVSVDKIRWVINDINSGTAVRVGAVSITGAIAPEDVYLESIVQEAVSDSDYMSMIVMTKESTVVYNALDASGATGIGTMSNPEYIRRNSSFYANADSARVSGAKTGTVGFDWGTAIGIKYVEVVAPSDGFSTSADGDVTIDVYASEDGTASGGTLVGTTTFADDALASTLITIADPVVAEGLYLDVSHDGTNTDCAVGTVTFYTDGSGHFLDNCIAAKVSRDGGATDVAVDMDWLFKTEEGWHVSYGAVDMTGVAAGNDAIYSLTIPKNFGGDVIGTIYRSE
jgi:hypothetical protein